MAKLTQADARRRLADKHARQTARLLQRQERARAELARKQERELSELVSLCECETEAVEACVRPERPRRPSRARPARSVRPPRRSMPAAPPRGATFGDIQQFAETVERTAADQPANHRFGEQVFLGPVFQRMLERKQVRNREHFRLLLQLARQRGLLSLSRADLVSAMDPALVRSSEFRDLNATWHLLTPRARASAGETDFVRQVTEAAREAGGGKRLVMITAVWREMRRRGYRRSLEDFKADLARAYRAEQLTLSKADMPQTLPTSELRDSTLRIGGRDLVFVNLLETSRQGAGFDSDFRRAFDSARSRIGGRNLVSLRVLREALPQYSTAEFDRGLWKLRKTQRFSLSAHEGRAGALPPRDAEAGIREAGRLLVYAAEREE